MKKKTKLIRKGLILDPEHPGYKDACWTITFGPRLNFKRQIEQALSRQAENNVEKDEEILEGDVLQFTIPRKKEDKLDEE